jgi:Cof subfamily protein (haloacid dehalogenase superfamily)
MFEPKTVRSDPQFEHPSSDVETLSEGGHATMSIKLLIADVDGTLVTQSKALTARTCDAVARLRAAGVDFTITSGRPPRGMAMLVGPLGLTAPVAAFNGGVYIKPDLKTVLVQRTIPAAVARRTVDFFLRAGLDAWVYRGTDWFIRKAEAPRVAREIANVQFEPVVLEDIHAVLEGAVKIVGVTEDRALMARVERELGAQLGSDAAAVRSHPAYLDVTHPDANKGMVVREAARLLGLSLDEVATIGDMPNDMSMLSIAGSGIAMANAGPDVQRVARHVTLSNEHDGFAHAVDTFILGQPPLGCTDLGLPPRTRACLFGMEGLIGTVDRGEGTVRYVKAARAAGLRTAVVADVVGGRALLRAAGLADLFDEQIDATAETSVLASYIAAAETLELEPEQIAVFARNAAGMEAGRAGHFCYLVRVDTSAAGRAPAETPFPTAPHLGADVVVPDLAALLR